MAIRIVVICLMVVAAGIGVGITIARNKKRKRILQEIHKKEVMIITRALSELDSIIVDQETSFAAGFGLLPLPRLRGLLPVCQVVDNAYRVTIGQLPSNTTCEARLGLLLRKISSKRLDVMVVR